MLWKRRTYLDYAAGASGNPSSPYEEGRRARKMLEDARTDIARLVEVQSDDVIFTSGATESNALAVLGITRASYQHQTLNSQQLEVGSRQFRPHVLYAAGAHASIVENMKLLAEEGVEIEELPLRDASVDTARLAKMLRPETVLVAMDAVCGETGVVWNTREVAHVLRTCASIPEKESAPQEYFHFSKPEYEQEKLVAPAARPIQLSFSGTPAPVLHVDASQAPLTEKLTRAHFGADTLALDASKVCSARGIGALIAHRTIPLAPLYRGGGQERGLRPGSGAPELAREFAAALRAAARDREMFRTTALHNRARLITAITKNIPSASGGNIHINEGRAQAPNILNISLPGRDPSRQGGAEVDTDYLVALLDEAGFAVSTRSACETDSEEGSRAVFALTGDRERARATLRISWGPGVRARELARFANALVRSVAIH